VKGMRWIRAVTGRIENKLQPFRTDALELRINCPGGSAAPAAVTQAQGMANGTPLALNTAFTPLGREPRLFDAFYLGSTEAFSKKNATVSLRFGLADSTVESYGVLELSWEYWNGTSWSRLKLTKEETEHFKSSGTVEFVVPADLEKGDWAGKQDFWIRARLIGGDYGREDVTVHTKDLGGGVTEQTFDRSTKGIRPPVVISLKIEYRLCDRVKPTFLFTQDSALQRNQSDANETDGALVEAFVPLRVSLGRLRGDGAGTTGAAAPGPPECTCAAYAPELNPVDASVADLNPPLPLTPATGRSIFLGFDAPLAGAGVNVLVIVGQERDGQDDAFGPLVVEALVGSRFVPLVAKDGTRALGESGILTLSFSDPPTQTALFGRSLWWLRLAPRAGAARDGARAFGAPI